MQADSLPAEPQRKPKNTGVDSLSLLQGDLPDPEVKPGSLALQADSLPTELSGRTNVTENVLIHVFSKSASNVSLFKEGC